MERGSFRKTGDPRFSLQLPAGTAFNYGVDYPDTRFDYGQVAQFATTEQCSGPLGPTYCDTVINPGI